MSRVDPITTEILRSALASAADEMAMALYRTSRSTIVRDALDFSTSLADADGQMIAQSVTIPLHMGAVPYAMETLFKKFDGLMEEGDVFILNDPFEGGMHIPDIFIVKPVFWEGKRIAFAIATAHHLDLGGRLPGSSACDNTEIFQDGFRIPWMKLFRRGAPEQSILELLAANIRVPELTLGDLEAQLAAVHIGQRAVLDLIRRYDVQTFLVCAQGLLDYTERLVRAEIATWPRGKFSFTDYLDSDGCGGPRTKIHVQLTVVGDTLTADFTGTDPQVRGALNCTLGFAASGVGMCVRAVMRDQIPNNSGMFRPIRVIAPAGTVVNVQMPGASSMRGITGFRVTDTVFGALAQMLPDRVMAAGEGGNTLVIFGSERTGGSRYVFYELLSGTWGGRPDRDGNDGLCNPANVASNIPIEQAESDYPIRIESYGLVCDSGGAGRFRGGMAVVREWRHLGNREASLVIRSDRRDHRPYGLQGGHAGEPSNNILRSGDQQTVLPTLVSTAIQPGEVIFHQMAGGGGWGDPMTRDPYSVAEDVRNERVSVDAARALYGVQLGKDGLTVNHLGTARLRAGSRTKLE